MQSRLEISNFSVKAKCAKDSYILELVKNSLQLDLKKFHCNREVSQTYTLSDIISLEN